MKKEVPPAKAKRPSSNVIRTPSHALFQSALALRQRIERDQRAQYLIQGVRFISLALDAMGQGAPPLDTLFYHPEIAGTPGFRLLTRARQNGVRCVPLSAELLHQLAYGADPQGLIGIAPFRVETLAGALPDSGLCWLGVESIRKAGNLGTILRTSQAAGGAGVIAVGGEVDFYDPTCVRSSMAALLGQKLVRASWREVVAWKRRHGITWVGTAPSATLEYDAVSYPRCPVLWMGDERQGLSERVLQECDIVVRIPMPGKTDSLNVSVATGLMIYEVLRQRRRALARSDISPRRAA